MSEGAVARKGRRLKSLTTSQLFFCVSACGSASSSPPAAPSASLGAADHFPWQASELGECPGAPQPLPRPSWVTGSGCPHEGRARPARGHRKHAIVPNALCLPKMTFAQNDLSALTRDGSNPTVSLLLELCKSPGQCWHQLKGSHTRPSSLVELPLTATR